MPGSARAIDAKLREPFDLYYLRIENMADEHAQDLRSYTRELIDAIREDVASRGTEHLATKNSRTRAWLLANAWAIAVLAFGLVAWHQSTNDRLAALEAHSAQTATAERELIQLAEQFKSFEVQTQKALERIESQLDGPRRR